MNPKDFAMGEADQLDYAYRLPLYSTMELFIETLTGTCFELRVSPYETVISVKAKIQRLEGIPITQQFLIWQNMELEDDYCLHDYNITDGCTLRLVLAMRGGPINTRRIAMEDPGLSDVADYVDSNREELFEKLSPPPSSGNKQVTLLVYHDGDQLNFFRVVDRGDGTLTPFSESLSGSACNLREADDDEDETTNGGQVRRSPGQQPLSVAQMVENNITAAKMKQLKSKMQNLQLQTQSNATIAKQFPSTIQATPIVKMQKHRSEANLHKLKSVPDKTSSPSSIGTTTIKKLPETQILNSSGLMEHLSATSKRLKTPNERPDDGKPGSSMCAKLMPITRADFRRAQLKRIKSVGDNNGVKDDMDASLSLEMRDNKIQDKANMEEKTKEAIDKPDVKLEVTSAAKEKTEKDATGRFSPRTRRLLNALESSTRRPPNVPTTTAYRSPRSTLLQGMTFNRHDMYLRSYGLIPSPDETSEERVVSPSSGESPTSKKLDDSDVPPKVLETSQGVKYSSLGASKGQILGAGSRFLKSPPDWLTSKDVTTHPTSSSMNWQNMPQPHQGYALGDSARLKEGVLKPPSTQDTSHAVRHKKSIYDSMIAKSSKNLISDSGTDKSSSKQWSKLDALRLPQPPTSNVALPAASWQAQRLRRLSMTKPSNETGLLSPRKENPTSDDPLLSARRPFRQTSSKSGLRMKESPPGKVESMSRQEAREVVDFINKAVDASILRTLVRSPAKENQRGNSGQNSHRHLGPGFRHADGIKSMLQAPHGNNRSNNRQPLGPPMLPPVKPPSKKKRCFLCAKRTGLASSYTCRCGNNFCATHRYAETHNCTYDYKTSGRKLLEEANPLVSAPKLPKI